MIKPDLIFIWPRAFDFPVVRAFIVRNRHLFDQVIISFTHNSVDRDYRKFLRDVHPDFTFVDSTADKNWYDDAVNIALNQVKSRYVLFMEQDFICSDKFIEDLLSVGDKYDFIALEQGRRLHLGCLLTQMVIINHTVRYFGTCPRSNLDCFDLFTAELEALCRQRGTTIDNAVLGDYQHLNGLVHNYSLFTSNRLELITDLPSFKKYNQSCLDASISKHESWVKIMEGVAKL